MALCTLRFALYDLHSARFGWFAYPQRFLFSPAFWSLYHYFLPRATRSERRTPLKWQQICESANLRICESVKQWQFDEKRYCCTTGPSSQRKNMTSLVWQRSDSMQEACQVWRPGSSRNVLLEALQKASGEKQPCLTWTSKSKVFGFLMTVRVNAKIRYGSSDFFLLRCLLRFVGFLRFK